MGTTHSQVEKHGQPAEALNEQDKADGSVYCEEVSGAGADNLFDPATADTTTTAAGEAAAASVCTEPTASGATTMEDVESVHREISLVFKLCALVASNHSFKSVLAHILIS